MKIEITSAGQFDGLLNALSSEVVHAAVCFKLYSDLSDAIREYQRVMNQSSAFWSLTLQATLDAALLRLCRAYDQHRHSLSLQNLLDTIKANLYIFGTDNFRQRLWDNPFVESLAQSARKPSTDMLGQDMELVNRSDPLVNKLVVWRDNIIAHTRASNVVNEKDIAKNYPLTKEEISQLVNRATSIVNRYSRLFRASTYSPQILGHDDYLYVLNSIKEKIQRQTEETQAHIARLPKSNGVRENGEVA